jgi:hypothetical protein
VTFVVGREEIIGDRAVDVDREILDEMRAHKTVFLKPGCPYAHSNLALSSGKSVELYCTNAGRSRIHSHVWGCFLAQDFS